MIWGISTVGSAQRSQCWGQGFDSPMLHQSSSNTNRRCFSSKKRSGWCLGDKVHGCCIKQQPLFFGLLQAQFFFQQSNALGYGIHALRSHSSRALLNIFDLLLWQAKADFLGARVICGPSHFFLADNNHVLSWFTGQDMIQCRHERAAASSAPFVW